MRKLFAEVIFGSLTVFSFLIAIITYFYSYPAPFGTYLEHPLILYSIIFFIIGIVLLVVGIAFSSKEHEQPKT
jgi:uncharacterized protein with PQ loop repeat